MIFYIRTSIGFLFFGLGGAASLGSDSKKDDGSFLAVEFALLDDELGQHDGASWCCINMVLPPEIAASGRGLGGVAS